MLAAIAAAERILVVGIGGGGDVVGALAVGELAATLGTPTVVGGLSWERLPIDPLPGPRRMSEITGLHRLNEHAGLAGADTSGPGGFRFAESHMARHLDEPVLLLDPGGGPAAVADGLQDAARQLDCDLVVLTDVGGDVLAHGDERGLSSPLADAVCLAAAPRLAQRGVALQGALFGAGCDGELTPEEVLARITEVAEAGGYLGDWGPGSEQLEPRRRGHPDPDGGQRDGPALRARSAGRDADPRRPPDGAADGGRRARVLLRPARGARQRGAVRAARRGGRVAGGGQRDPARPRHHDRAGVGGVAAAVPPPTRGSSRRAPGGPAGDQLVRSSSSPSAVVVPLAGPASPSPVPSPTLPSSSGIVGLCTGVPGSSPLLMSAPFRASSPCVSSGMRSLLPVVIRTASLPYRPRHLQVAPVSR